MTQCTAEKGACKRSSKAKPGEVAREKQKIPTAESGDTETVGHLQKYLTVANTAMNLEACEIAVLTGALRERLTDFVNAFTCDSIEDELRESGLSRQDADDDCLAMDLLYEARGFLWTLEVYDDVLTGRIIDKRQVRIAERIRELRKSR